MLETNEDRQRSIHGLDYCCFITRCINRIDIIAKTKVFLKHKSSINSLGTTLRRLVGNYINRHTLIYIKEISWFGA